MKKFNMDKKSVFFKMTSFVIVLIIIQAIFLTGTLIVGGVLSQAQDNAFQSFHDKVQNRNNYIQREMKNRWTNMSPYIERISDNLSDSDNNEAFFESTIDDLIDMLRMTQTTGAFVILEGDQSDYPALYIRDYDPLLNDYSNKDLYMILGSSDLAKEYMIPLDKSWKYKMEFNDTNKDFFEKPFSKAPLTFNADLLGYWNSPFLLFEDDLPIITYTMPIFDANKVLRGVIGIELSVNYFNQFLPATDLKSRDSMGYLMGYSAEGVEKIKPMLITGALQKRMIRSNEIFDLTKVDLNRDIYIIGNHNSEEKIYACVERMGLYNANTPFEDESWYLIGMMTEGHILSYVKKIQKILWMSLVASIVIGMIGGHIISYQFTKPITEFVKQVKSSEKNKPIRLFQTGLMEIDALSSAMENANNALLESTVKMSKIIGLTDFPIGAFEIRSDSDYIFVTDQFQTILDIDNEEMCEIIKSKVWFLNKLQSKLTSPVESENNVYKMSMKDEKYVRVKIIENALSTMGVVIDVSDEVIEKNRIKMERDYDALTMIFNRKAVQLRIENVIENVRPLDVAALIMFDLDYLKKINDTYGHKWGDFYISSAAAALSKIDANSSVLGRRSGDEFVLFLFGFKNKDAIRKIMNEFYDVLSKDLITFPDGSLKPISISGGLLWIDNWSLSYDELLHKSDELLYGAKNEKKGYYIEGDM